MNDAVVADTSLAVKWFLLEELSEEARELLEAWKGQGLRCFMPSWFACEVSNVLYKSVLRGVVRVPEAQVLVRQLLETVAVHDFEPAISERALELAHVLGQRATYDAHYLALAEHLDCDLWTADERFWNTTRRGFPRIRWLGEVVGRSSL